MRKMSITRPNICNTLYIIFYNFKTKCDSKKRTLESDCTPKKHVAIEKNKSFLCVHKVK